MGGEFHFDTLVDDIIIKDNKALGVRANNKEFISSHIVLAIGHSARDTYNMLYNKGVFMEQRILGRF